MTEKAEMKNFKPTDIPEEVIQKTAASLNVDAANALDLIVAIERELRESEAGLKAKPAKR